MRKSVTVWVEQLLVGGEVKLGVEQVDCDSNFQMASLLSDGLHYMMQAVARERVLEEQSRAQEKLANHGVEGNGFKGLIA